LFLFVIAMLPLAACGGQGGSQSPTTIQTVDDLPGDPPPPPPFDPDFALTYLLNPVAYAVETEVTLPGAEDVEHVEFEVHTKPGGNSDDVKVTLRRAYLDRIGAIAAAQGKVRFAIFGLYAGYANEVTVRVKWTHGAEAEKELVIVTGPAAFQGIPTTLVVESVEPALDASFLMIQSFGTCTIVDIDGEVRWQHLEPPESVFPSIFTPTGPILASTSSGSILRYDWLGRFEHAEMDDPRCHGSHHNLAWGKTGILNTIEYTDENDLRRGLTVLAETTAEGQVLRTWDFDTVFTSTILAAGEGPNGFVTFGVNWFHMNSAIYDPSDDSVIASSRENFVVKADHQTGAIKWILGSPQKSWFTDYPASLRPLALHVIGDAPIGQHSLSVTPDGRHLMLFNNGLGNLMLPDVGDSRTYSKVSIYEIDDAARTATEVWSYDHAQSVFSPICSSAYPTAGGNVLVTYSSPQDMDAFIEVVNPAKSVRFRAHIEAGDCGRGYSTQEVPFTNLVID
jgi:hypothetical protein